MVLSGYTLAKRQTKVTEKLPSPIDIEMGYRVKMSRLVLGMSQEFLAAQLGISFQQVQKYEDGASRISVGRLHAIAQVFGVPAAFFFERGRYEDVDFPFENLDDNGGVLNELMRNEGLELNKAFMKIKNPDLKRAVIALARGLITEPEKSHLIITGENPKRAPLPN